MICNGDMTVWHFDEDAEIYSRQYFPNVFKSFSKSIVSGKAEISRSDHARVRIPTASDIGIYEHDLVRFGCFTDEHPDKTACLKVMTVRDNRFGANPHWRIDLE